MGISLESVTSCSVCWLSDLLQSKASGSPVMVVGTHLDRIPSAQRAETGERLRSLFEKEYLDRSRERLSLRVDPYLYLVNTLDSANVQFVRDAIYDCALSYSPSLSRSEFDRLEEGVD